MVSHHSDNNDNDHVAPVVVQEMLSFLKQAETDEHVCMEGITLTGNNKAQCNAIRWLAEAAAQEEEDALLYSQPTSTEFLQRYVLAVLYFSTNGDDDWLQCSRQPSVPCDDESSLLSRFLSTTTSVCNWYGIKCTNKNDDKNKNDDYISKRTIFLMTGSFSTMMSIVILRLLHRYYNTTRTNKDNNDNNKKGLSLSSFPWNPKSISSLIEAPFALAFANVKEGFIHQIWMNEYDKLIVYFDENDQLWKRSTCLFQEQIQELTSQLLLLSTTNNNHNNNHNKQVHILPRSKLQIYKTVAWQTFMTSSPFLYLIAMYYMLQKLYKQQSNNDNDNHNHNKDSSFQEEEEDTISLRDVAGMTPLISELSWLYESAQTNHNNNNNNSSINNNAHYNAHVLLYGPHPELN